jgi:hypothetical protein
MCHLRRALIKESLSSSPVYDIQRMKRTIEEDIEATAKPLRDYDVILAEEREAFARWNALDEEVSRHPEGRQRRERAIRQALMNNLPPALHHELLDVFFPDKGCLLSIDVDGDTNGDEVVWTFHARFEEDFFDKNWKTSGKKDFKLVSFDHRPLRLWHRALDANADEVASALAAFCFACCTHLDDDHAMPAGAFEPPPKGKEKEEEEEEDDVDE